VAAHYPLGSASNAIIVCGWYAPDAGNAEGRTATAAMRDAVVRERVRELHRGFAESRKAESDSQLDWGLKSQPDVRAGDDRKGEWRGQPDGNGQLLYGFPPTRILATSRSLSNIFLHRRQNSEKVGENSFVMGLKLWKDGGIRAFFLMVQVKRQ
jgi:hypothetical protein